MVRAGRGSLGRVASAAAVAVALAFVPASAHGAAAGATTLVLSGAAAKSLRAKVTISPHGAARGNARRIVLPVRAGLAGEATSVLTHRGAIALRYRGRTVRLTRLRLLLGKRSRLRATIRGRGVDVFAVRGGGRAVSDPAAGTVRLGGARLKLTRAGARAIAAGLGRADRRRRAVRGRVRGGLKLRPGHLGGISTRATGLAGGGDPVEEKRDDTATSSGCQPPAGPGPEPEDPLPVAGRPAEAVDVSGATIEWHVRESFIRYIATGEGTSVSGGATADPPVLLQGASTPLAYDFHFPFASGWHDAGANPGDPGDDRAAIYFGGSVRFRYSDHEIDLSASAPEIELAGAASRAIFVIAEDGTAGTRQVLVNLDLGRAATVEASGDTHTYRDVPGAIPAGTAGSVFAGFYAPGAEFGCFTVSYTTG